MESELRLYLVVLVQTLWQDCGRREMEREKRAPLFFCSSSPHYSLLGPPPTTLSGNLLLQQHSTHSLKQNTPQRPSLWTKSDRLTGSWGL